MSLIRLFMCTTYEMAIAGQWSLMAEYFSLIAKVLTTKEAHIKFGTPIDKPTETP